jgi:hypothetical protein
VEAVDSVQRNRDGGGQVGFFRRGSTLRAQSHERMSPRSLGDYGLEDAIVPKHRWRRLFIGHNLE